MKHKILNIILLMTPIVLLLMIFNASAFNNTIESSIDTDKAVVKQGEVLTAIIKLPNKDALSAYKAQLSYDEDVWEIVSQNNFSSQNNWQYLKYNSSNKNFILINKEENPNPEILEVVLFAKKNAKVGTTKIMVDDISASDNINEYRGESIQKEIQIIENTEYQEDNPNKDNDLSIPSKEEKPTNENIEITIDKTFTNNINKNPTTSIVSQKENTTTVQNEVTTSIKNNSNPDKSTITETSKKDYTKEDKTNKIYIYIIIGIMLLLLIILSIYSKKGQKTLMIIAILTVLLSNFLPVYASSAIFLGDISKNSLIDDADIELLEEHLIDLNIIKNINIADMNNDNSLSIIDVSLLINQQRVNPYDTYNVTNITKWEPVPIVSSELLEKDEVTIGGEGCQWPIGMALSKDGKLMLIGTDVGGVYRSTDGGKTFAQANAGLYSRGVSAFAIDPNNSSYVIAIGINSYAFDSNGPHISEDGGNTWKITKSMLIKGHRDIRESVSYDASSYDPSLNRTLIAYWSTAYDTEDNNLSDDEKGLYKTTDGGYTWELINSSLHDGTIKVNPYTGELYVSKADGIYYSSDKGNSFKKLVNDNINGFDLITTPTKTTIFYCNNNGLYKFINNREFIRITSNNYPTKAYNLRVSPTDNNKMVLVNREGDYQNYPYYSLDGGITWEKSILDNSLSMMPYNNRLSIPLWSPVGNKVWLFVQGDFVSSSIDSGKTFKWDSNGITGILSGGLVHYNVYNPDIIYFGSQDYNGAVTTDGGATWKYINMSENRWGGFCYGGYAVDENTFFVGVADSWYSPRKLKITFDGGKTIIDTGLYFTQENLRNSTESSYQSPTNPKVLFAADLRSDDGGHTWKKMNGCINVYTHNPKGKKELYGRDESGEYVVVSFDDGLTWKKVNNNKFQPNMNYAPLKIDDLAYDWKHESIYVACGYGYLYRVNVNDGTQEYVINKYLEKYRIAPLNQKGSNVITKVAVDPNDPNIVYCGGPGNTFMNDSALYRSVDGGKTFQVVTSNTKNSIIKEGPQGGFETNSLEVNPTTGELLFAGGCFGISKLSPPYKK